MNIRENLFPRVKSEIQIRENFPRETWKIQNPRKFSYLMVSGDVEIVNDFVYRAIECICIPISIITHSGIA